MEYIALLGNVNKSILGIDLGDGFKIKQMHLFDFAQCCEEEFGIEDVWAKIDFHWGCVHDDRYRPEFVYIITKTFDDYPMPLDSEDSESRMQSLPLELGFRDAVSKYLNDKVTKLRLLREGSIRISLECYFELDEDGFREFKGGSESTLPCEHRLYELTGSSEIDLANTFLKSLSIAKLPKYLRFALSNFEQSYEVTHKEFEYLSLMIALEALLNDGKSELRLRISRGCAVLLGHTIDESQEIFKNSRDLYDKRSVLVHTGDGSKVTELDVLSLKDIVRRSLKKSLELNLPKQELSKLLMESGFGSLQ